MKFIDLSESDIRQIVRDIFEPKKITCVKKHKRDDEITCKIYTEWGCGEENIVIADEITLRNPFDYGTDAICVDFSVSPSDYRKLKQFCYAKGVYGESIDWLINNPYIVTEGT